MTYKKLIRMFDERKSKLASLLSDDSIELKEDRQNQIKGAIDEIELFLMTLQQYQDREVRKNFDSAAAAVEEPESLAEKVAPLVKAKKRLREAGSLAEKYGDEV
jgi:acyl-CoA reductase-like NAD-dependent aldehyde dehydrogenase